MSVTTTGSVIVPASVLTAIEPPSTTPTLCRGPERDAGDRTLGGARQERLARLQPTRVEQLVPGGEDRRARADGRRLRGCHGRCRDARAVPAAELVELGVHRRPASAGRGRRRARRRAGPAPGGRPGRASRAPAGTDADVPPT